MRTATARAAASARQVLGPASGQVVAGAGTADLAVLPAAPSVPAPLLLASRPRPPTTARPSSLPSGPAGRSPPAAV